MWRTVCSLSVAFFLSTQAFAAGQPDLTEKLAEVKADRLFTTATVGVQVVDLSSGEEVWSVNPDKSMSPASTMKVLTAATALKNLGPAYRFETAVFRTGPIEAGVVKGDLVIRGGGDPSMVIEKLWKLVYDLRLNGVTKIEGNLVFDESFLETDYRLPGWTKKRDIERGPSYFPSLSALSLNFNTIALVVTPGAEGKKANASLETPADSYIELVNEVVTGKPGSSRSVTVKREVLPGKMRFTLTGSVPPDARPWRAYRTVADPTAYFMSTFTALLAQQEIEVTGDAVRGVTPEAATEVLTVASPPLTTVLMDMNKYSNNFMAELVLRVTAAEVSEETGSTQKGLELVRSYLESIGVPPSEVELVNGSGLSRDAELRPSHLTAVLIDMAKDPQVGHEFYTSLAIAGMDGTLSKRLDETPNRLRGKTGTLDGVHCLAGYLDAADGRQYAFAFMVNDVKGGLGQVRRLHDDFARRMIEPDPSDSESSDSSGTGQ